MSFKCSDCVAFERLKKANYQCVFMRYEACTAPILLWLERKLFLNLGMSIVEKYRPQFTYEDYCLWEGRWELIEGMPYAMSPSPNRMHQHINGKLLILFDTATREHCSQCRAYMAPLDWKINSKTVVQPDLMIVCGKFTTDFLEFAPALTVEILSKSTAFKDRHEKLELYEQEGVEYYMIVDPEFNKIEIYQLADRKFKLAVNTPEQFEFTFKNGCHLPISFTGIWDQS